MFAKFGFYLNYHFSTALHWERNCKSDKARITTSVLPGKSRGLITRIAMMVKLTKGRTLKTTLRILLLLLCSKFVLQSWGSLVSIHQICNFFWHQHWMSRPIFPVRRRLFDCLAIVTFLLLLQFLLFSLFLFLPPIPVTPAIPGTHSSCFPPAAITYILLFNPRWAQFEHFTKTKKKAYNPFFFVLVGNLYLIFKLTILFWFIMLLFPSVFPSYLVVLTWSSIFILLGGHCAGH